MIPNSVPPLVLSERFQSGEPIQHNWLDNKRHCRLINFRATEAVVATLSDLRKLHSISMSDSIRKGIALFAIAKRGETKNQRLALINQDGTIAAEIELI